MKIKKLLISIFLTTCFCSLPILSIGATNIGVLSTSESKSLVYLQNFNAYRDMYNCGFVNFFGKIELSEENAISGTSAKIHIEQAIAYSQDPCMHVDLKSEACGYDYSDFSMIDYVGFYVYNANDFNGTINFKITDTDNKDIVNEFYSVPAKSGLNIRKKVDRTEMKIYDVSAKKLRFSMDNVNDSVWFFDDIYVEKAIDEIVIENKSFSSNDILNFNDFKDLNYVKKDSAYTSTAHITSVKLSNDGGIVKDGYALKVEFNRTLLPDIDYTIQPKYFYSGIALGAIFYDYFDFDKLWTKNICFDVYSAMNKTMRYVVRLTDGVGTVFDKEYQIEPNEWHTFRVNFNECGENTTLRFENISKISLYVDYQNLDGDLSAFYIDNIRLEDI